jgi:hypothetical protein
LCKAKTGVATQSRIVPLVPDIKVCIAILAGLHTTLVLEADTRDFSTDAGNSALIVKMKFPQRLVAPFISGPAGR